MYVTSDSTDPFEPLAGSQVTLTCTSRPYGAGSTYTFIKDGNPLTSQSGSAYVINNVTSSHSGTYTCKVTVNSLTSVASSSSVITVRGELLDNAERSINYID